MDPISLILGAASIGGGLMSALGGRKAIDPEWLRQHFGAEAVNQEMIQLFNSVINSPVGQQMIASAAEQGQQFAHDTARQSAIAGFGPGGGADSGASIFAAGAAGGAPEALTRGVKANVMESVFPVAAQNVQNRMNIAAQSKMNTPTTMESFGNLLGTAGSLGLQAHQAGQATQGVAPQRGGTAPTAGLAQNFNEAVAQPTMIQPRGSLAGMPPVELNQGGAGPKWRGPGFTSRFGRRIARFGNMVTPGNPFGNTY